MAGPRIWTALAAITGWYLSGLAVTVALVVYPAFARVGPDRWAAYHRAHQRAVLAAVGPAWVLEGVATLGWLLTALGSGPLPGTLATWQTLPGTLATWQTLPRTLAIGHALAAAATVAATVLAAVPAHGSLAAGFRARAHRRLLRAHRVRTLAWLSAALLATAGLATAGLAS